MRGHVDAESLALCAEGLLSRRRTARVRAHLTGCAACARTATALGEVTTRLSQVPAPPLPAAVAARLDAALSAESAQRAASPAPAPVPTTAPAGAPGPRPPRRGPLWSPSALRILAAAGVAVVVAGGVGYGLSQLSGSSSSSSSSHSGAAAVPAASANRAPNAEPNLGTSPGPRMHSGANPGGTTTRYIRSDTDYRAGTLVVQAQQKLAVYDVPGITGPGIVPATQVPATVLDCVSRIAGTRRVVLVDQARYERQPAIVMVLDTPETVKAVSSSCRVLNSAPLPVTSGTGTR
jgi:hypothetical protein